MSLLEKLKLPNCKEIFIPDNSRMGFANGDYSGADAMVVAYDSDCEWLINFFATSKEKLYVYMAREYLQKDITEKDPWYKRFKMYCHLTNYGGKELKAAQSCGISVFEARRIRQWYFGLCPEIPEWHLRIESTIRARRPITNIFGAEAWYLNLDDPTVLNQAYAWIPQSTIGILVNKGWYNIRSKEGWTYPKKLKSTVHIGSVKLQVHDALLVQYPLIDITAPQRIKEHMEIILPYPKPLKVPVDLKLSAISYGDCR
jgi:hypothetical protein